MPSLTPSPETPQSAHERLNATFSSGITLPLSFRIAQLKALRTFLNTTEQEHLKAIHSDLRKSQHDFFLYDFRILFQDIAFFIRNLRRLARPTYAARDLGAPVHIEPHPKGAVLVFGPFNFPTQLVIRPMIAAIAAGNVVCAKPSEMAPASEAFLLKLRDVLDERIIAVVTGGVDTCNELLTYKWDHIMFTGSGNVGRIVMSAAAKHLTPVTLELGGKNPAIVTQSAHVDTAVASIVRSRFTNCGQICLAPDYCLVDDAIYDQFVPAVVAKVREVFGETPQTCPHFGRLISTRHWTHVTTMLQKTKGTVLIGGQTDDADQHYVAPTVVEVTSREDSLMTDEIFGPVLPILRVKDVNESLDEVNKREKPLALYLFCTDAKVTKHVVARTRSGSVGVNETVLQIGATGSHLGGVGESGMGAYGYSSGFKTFSHHRPVMYSRPLWANFLAPLQPHVGSVSGKMKGWLETYLRVSVQGMPLKKGNDTDLMNAWWMRVARGIFGVTAVLTLAICVRNGLPLHRRI